jgi:hypothetical protein
MALSWPVYVWRSRSRVRIRHVNGPAIGWPTSWRRPEGPVISKDMAEMQLYHVGVKWRAECKAKKGDLGEANVRYWG